MKTWDFTKLNAAREEAIRSLWKCRNYANSEHTRSALRHQINALRMDRHK